MVRLPPALAALVEGATWEQVTLGESGARVYRLRSGIETRYLKVEPRRSHSELHAEAERLRRLQGRLPVPALLYAGVDERQSYLLTAEVPGADASDERWLADPARLVALLAEGLLLIHRQPVAGCPFDQRLHTELARAAANVAAGAVDADDFDEERAGRTPASLLDELHATRPPDEDLVLIHGDYCFSNVVVKDWALSGFIDLGRCGVADRYDDLAQAARSVRRNLGERWVAPFFAAYGISEADDSLAATLAPLSAAFVCEPASGDRAILEIVRYVSDVGRRRVSGQDGDTTPLILWVDELTSLLGRSSVAGELAELLERVAQEYRKRAVFVCASGQIWTAARTSSELRDSFASVLCHRMKRAQARLLLPTEEAEQAERLAVGQAVLWRTSGETSTVQIPLTTAQDVQRVAGLLATGRPTAQPLGSQIEAPPQPPDMPASSQVVVATERLRSSSVSAEAARAATMFLDGLDPAAIVWELRQVKSSQGGKYQAALGEVLGLIRDGLRPA